MGAVGIAWHTHQTPSPSASSKIPREALPTAPPGPRCCMTRYLSPAQRLWGARRGLRGTAEPGERVLAEGHTRVLYHLHTPNKNIEFSLPHPHSLTHLPGPVLPPHFKGPLRVLEMSSKMQPAAWVHGWRGKH